MAQSSTDGEGAKQWSTPALERLDLSGTRSGKATANIEYTYRTSSGSAYTVSHPAPHS